MFIDEGGVPSGGSLSDYVASVFNQRTNQEAEIQRLNHLATQTNLEQFIQVTSPLRNYLLQLAAPIDELLTHFKVRELLEEARNICDAHKAEQLSFNNHPFALSERKYRLEDLRPQIYQQVVSDPQPPKFFQHPKEDRKVSLDEISDSDNFTRWIPHLDGYGLALNLERRKSIQGVEMQRVWLRAEGSNGGWSGPEYTAPSMRVPAHWGYDLRSIMVPVRIVKATVVEAIKSETGSGYDLMYSHQLSRIDLRGRSSYSSDKHMFLVPPTMIKQDDSTEVLGKLVGDDVVRELDGKYLDLLHQFEERGER